MILALGSIKTQTKSLWLLKISLILEKEKQQNSIHTNIPLAATTSLPVSSIDTITTITWIIHDDPI